MGANPTAPIGTSQLGYVCACPARARPAGVDPLSGIAGPAWSRLSVHRSEKSMEQPADRHPKRWWGEE